MTDAGGGWAFTYDATGNKRRARRPPGEVYGTPSIVNPAIGRRSDPDTGQAMENCIRRKLNNQ